MSVSAAPVTRPRHESFEFSEASLGGSMGRTISLRYRLCGGPDPDLAFNETLELPPELPAPDPSDPVVRALIDGIHRMFGVSYYKAAVPRRLLAPAVGAADAAFWDVVYSEGLGEFYYRNQLDPRAHEPFPRDARIDDTVNVLPIAPAARERALVLVGGGKDSIVAREIVRHAGVDADAMSLGTAPWIERSVASMGLSHLILRRKLDPQLTQLNQRGAWNGHIPISACIAFAAQLVAYLGGYSAVIVGNERTADEANLVWNGISINHQWSKSFGFEQAFDAWCQRHFRGGPRYFSLLRPLSELRIAEAFSRHPEHFGSFTSCNANFRQNPSAEPARFCGHCPKCVFVYLMLAPYLADPQLAQIFGDNVLADTGNKALLEELAGLARVKPFECVGTPDETRAALAQLTAAKRLPATLDAWLTPQLDTTTALASWHAIREPHGDHGLSAAWEKRLYAYLDAHRA